MAADMYHDNFGPHDFVEPGLRLHLSVGDAFLSMRFGCRFRDLLLEGMLNDETKHPSDYLEAPSLDWHRLTIMPPLR